MTPMPKVININKKGEVFDPRHYVVPIKGNEAIIKRLREIVEAVENDREK